MNDGREVKQKGIGKIQDWDLEHSFLKFKFQSLNGANTQQGEMVGGEQNLSQRKNNTKKDIKWRGKTREKLRDENKICWNNVDKKNCNKNKMEYSTRHLRLHYAALIMVTDLM